MKPWHYCVLATFAFATGLSAQPSARDITFPNMTLDRASKDFTPAVLSLRAAPPDVIVAIVLPPAGYILMNQLYEPGAGKYGAHSRQWSAPALRSLDAA